MKQFIEFVLEAKNATSLDDEQLGHLTHAKDIAHEDPKHIKQAHDLIHEFHKLRQGKPSKVEGSLKTDGGSSVHIIHDEHGVGVSDKHRFKRGIIARTPKEIDQYFGHAPAYAASLKHLLKHGAEIVNKGHHVQADFLHSPEEKPEKSDDHISVTPNRITYKAKTDAPLGIAIHTEYKNGVAYALSDNALKKSKNIFVAQHKFDPKKAEYSREAQTATEHHLKAAASLMKGHKTEHLTPDHRTHFTTYLNRTTRSDTVPSLEGYKAHLAAEGKKAADKLKSEAGKQKKLEHFNSLIKHVDDNQEHFHRSIEIRHHLGQATEHVLKGIKHPDMETSIDGKESPGEGIVIQQHGRPMAKLVPQKVSHAILNNTRFKKQ